MAAVKGILGNQVCALVPCGADNGVSATTGAKAAAPPSPTTTVPPAPAPPAAPTNPIDQLLRRVLGA
jgi:hypothetical protein